MAKGDVVLKFDANTAAAVQEIAKLLEQVKAGADGVNKFGQSFAKAGDHADAFAHKIKHGMTELVGMLALPTTIMGGFEAVMKGIEARIALAEERSKALAIRSATFESAMFTLGTQGSASEIRKHLEARTKLGFGFSHPSPNQTESIFGQIVSSVGRRASPEQFEAATTTAMEARARGANDEQVVQIGSSMAIIQAMAPHLSENEADQLARFFQKNAPGVLGDEKLLGAVLRQKPENRQRAMGMAAAMYQGHQPLKQAQRLFDMVSQGRATFDRILENPDSLPLQERFIARAVSEGASKLKSVGSREDAFADFAKGLDPTSRANMIQKDVDAAHELLLDTNSSEDTINRAKAKLARDYHTEEHPYWAGITPGFVYNIPLTPEYKKSLLVGAIKGDYSAMARARAETYVDQLMEKMLDAQIRANKIAQEHKEQDRLQGGPPNTTLQSGFRGATE